MSDARDDRPANAAPGAHPEAHDATRYLARFEAVAPAVYAWACLHIRPSLRPRLDPDDLLQEVAARSYERFAGWDPARGSFRAWLFGIARHVLHEALRRVVRDPATPAVDGVPTARLASLADTATSISRALSRDERFRSLLDEVERLDRDDRHLVLARGLEGLPFADVARLTGLSREAAKKRWQRLRVRLREVGGRDDLID